MLTYIIDSTTSFGTTDSNELWNLSTNTKPSATELLHKIQSDVTNHALFETTDRQTGNCYCVIMHLVQLV